ncbi:TPA: DEAD/DEAH box helicase [Legionella pneumophila]|uniref:DEAD/DEAH box helicase n=1 Tax=Legionella pneumophila TaxID=446 RepID=UPI000787392E|nr:DEAD/DEAH box helicase [Legionella pneumophila]HAU0031601.1 DEAD/DEAH box helicase [Legionella pneumophila]HAU0037741.1 DEAD/DEAH box helicase [Legionella pneumophila]HAU0040795.1 DEAD/DEAH box helicase [Legionella pneumophila]HAU0061638.1 DEAD/DEAH box helicase [Legionella pneumophila]HAU0067722.1 DEAD/DEAH box helicase [Legionella pneumophila]
MLNIIHLFWDPTTGFYNDGKFVIWIESPNSNKVKGNNYPYQPDKAELMRLCDTWFASHINSYEKKEVILPCNEQGQPIPSSVIANLSGLNDLVITRHTPWVLQIAWVKEPLAFLRDLNFQHHYFEDTVQLGYDAQFWISVGLELSKLINKDHYIPAFVAKKDKNRTEYYAKWQSLSHDYQKKLSILADKMPLSACLSETLINQPFSVLNHFTEVTLNTLLNSTSYTKQLEKLTEDSCIELHLKGAMKSIALSESVWKDWKSWKNNLDYDQFGAPFYVCFRLNEPDKHEAAIWTIEVLLQAKSDPSFMITLNDYWVTKEKNTTLYTNLLGTSVERTLLLQLGYACRIYLLIEQLFQSAQLNGQIQLSTEEAFQFLKEACWTLHAAGYRIIVPSWWTPKGRLKAKIKLNATKSIGSSVSSTSYFSKEGLMRFNYQLTIGDAVISQEEWQQLVNAKQSLVYFRGQWMEINAAQMQQIRNLIDDSNQNKTEGRLRDLLQLAADEEQYHIEMDNHVSQLMDNLYNKDKLTLMEQPQGLQATLRPYQLRGLAWLHYLESIGLNPCLADDMGLGKTIQVIALMLKNPQVKASLLIAPTSVIGNWVREIEKFAPSIKVAVHHGNQRKTKNFETLLADSDIVITSYGLLRRDKSLFHGYHWARVILDEAQNIKNPSATQTKMIFSIKSDSKIALSGTPVENRLLDLWSIFNFLNPGLLGNRSGFKNQFELPIQRENDPKKVKVLKKIIEPFILRRLKSDKSIIKDLPDKIEQKVYCQLTKEQASLYQTIVNEVADNIDQLEDSSSRSNLILSILLRLKQVCNHPAQALGDGSEFSIERSFKLRRFIEMIQETMNNRESLLIFSQYKEICDSLNELIKTRYGYTTYQLDGNTSRTKREEMINQFQDPETPPAIFILSLKAGGVGITLTKANHVFHFDRWWNPAVENQATDRAYRIGQKRSVFAYKFITLGTIEERIDQMLEDKQKLSDTIVGHDESWLTKLDAKSFIELIKLSQTALAEEE